MSKRARRNHVAAFEARVALAAVKGEKTLAALAQQDNVHSNLINQWRSRLLRERQARSGWRRSQPSRQSTSRCWTPGSAS